MAEAEAKSSPSKKHNPLLGRLLIVALMGSVIVGECLFAYFWLPSAAEVEAAVEQQMLAEKASEQDTSDDRQSPEAASVEVDLGKFTITDHRPDANATIRVDFHLVGTVAESRKADFDKLFERNKNRFRHVVLIQIRESAVADLGEAGLGLIKRRILEKSNELLGETLLLSVVFSEYSFVDQ